MCDKKPFFGQKYPNMGKQKTRDFIEPKPILFSYLDFVWFQFVSSFTSNSSSNFYSQRNKIAFTAKHDFIQWYLLFKITMDPIVTQKKMSGHSLVGIMANPTVTIKTITSIIMLHTIRGVRLPLK